MESVCVKEAKQLIIELKTDMTNGLTEQSVARARRRHGKNGKILIL